MYVYYTSLPIHINKDQHHLNMDFFTYFYTLNNDFLKKSNKKAIA